MRPLANTPPVTWTRMRTRTRMRTNFGGRSMKTQNPPSPFWRMLKTLSVYLRTPEYVRSHKNCIVHPKFGDSAAVHYKVQYSPYFTTVRIVRTSITLPGTVLYTWHIRTRYQEYSGTSYIYGTWYFTGIYLPNISRLCSSGYVQNIPGVFTPGITLQRNSVCL